MEGLSLVEVIFLYIQEFISGLSILLTDDSVTFYVLLKISVFFFFIKWLGVVSWTGPGTWVLDLAKIPDQIAVSPSACLLNSESKTKAIILTIGKEPETVNLKWSSCSLEGREGGPFSDQWAQIPGGFGATTFMTLP